MSFHYRGPECALIPHPLAGPGDGKTYGAAMLPGPCGRTLGIIFSDGEGWEHVSVSQRNRKHLPNWREMCFVKDLFWGEEDCVVQFHPPKSRYVNRCPNCLHLWRSTKEEMPQPDPTLVGPSKTRSGDVIGRWKTELGSPFLLKRWARRQRQIWTMSQQHGSLQRSPRSRRLLSLGLRICSEESHEHTRPLPRGSPRARWSGWDEFPEVG